MGDARTTTGETPPAPRRAPPDGRPVRERNGEVLATPPCPVCAATRARPRFAVEGIAAPVVACERCGTARFHPLPAAGALAACDPSPPGLHPWLRVLARAGSPARVSFLSFGLPKGARVLDLGGGDRALRRALARRGLEVHGVERSGAAAGDGDRGVQVRVAACLADAGHPESYFDQVQLGRELGPLPDPRATLAEVRRILRPGGRLIVAIPHLGSRQARWSGAGWFHLDLPRNLHHFPLPALHRLLDETGFERVSDHHFSPLPNAFGWIQSAQNRFTSLPQDDLFRMLRGQRPAPPARAGTRAAWLVGLVLAAPLALAAAGWDALRRDGATVHVLALRRPGT